MISNTLKMVDKKMNVPAFYLSLNFLSPIRYPSKIYKILKEKVHQ